MTQLLGYCVTVANSAFWAAEPDTVAVQPAPTGPAAPDTSGDRWRAELEQNLESLRTMIMAERH